jgi:hypothetical protein
LPALQSAPPPYNLILAEISGTAAGVQIDLLRRNPPQYPKFASGGIVPGDSFSGDNIITRQNSGEMDINREDQQKLWEAIKSGNLGGEIIQITIVQELDSQVLSSSVFEVGSRGNSFIRARGVIR